MRTAPGRAALLLIVVGLAGACALPPESPTAAPATSPPTAPPVTVAPRPTATPAPTFAVHAVRTGDTLIGLARRFGTTPESLAYWNRARYPSLDPDSPAYRPDRIEIGWELVYLPGRVVDPEDLPPPASGEPATPPPVVGPFPTLPPDGSAAYVTAGPAGLAGVALTFEYGGGGAGSPEAIVEWLARNGVPATVFLAPAAADPADTNGAAVLRRLAASEGIATGILGGPGGAPLTDAGLRTGDGALATVLGRSTAPYVRPAGGPPTPAELRAAGLAGWSWAIGWDVDPGDGVGPEAGGPIATDIVARVVSRSSGGSIVRLRLTGPRTLEALPGLVEALAADGLAIVPLDDVLGR